MTRTHTCTHAHTHTHTQGFPYRGKGDAPPHLHPLNPPPPPLLNLSWGKHCTHAHTHTHACTHTHVHTHSCSPILPHRNTHCLQQTSCGTVTGKRKVFYVRTCMFFLQRHSSPHMYMYMYMYMYLHHSMERQARHITANINEKAV